MPISYDPAKQARTLVERGLDFEDAPEVFAGPVATMSDLRKDYGEPRFVTEGHLEGRFVVIVWTPRGERMHVISMRYGHGKEERRFQARLGRSG